MIRYVEVDIDDIKRVEPLWKELVGYLASQSITHQTKFKNKVFEKRISPYLDKVKDGAYRIVIAQQDGIDVGYCFSSVTKDLVGEVDSIYVKDDFRSYNIGSYFMNDALAFFKQQKTSKSIVMVSEGNEEVIAFYQRHGYQLRYYVLHHKD